MQLWRTETRNPPSNPQPAAPHWSIRIDRPWRAVPLSSQCTRARLRLGRSPKRRKISAALAVSLPHTSAGRLPDSQDAHKRWSGLEERGGASASHWIDGQMDPQQNGSSATEKHDDNMVTTAQMNDSECWRSYFVAVRMYLINEI